MEDGYVNGAQGLLGMHVTAGLPQLEESKEAGSFKVSQTLSLPDRPVLSVKASAGPRIVSITEQRVGRCWENK